MGNLLGSLRSTGNQVLRKLPPAPSPDEISMLSRIAAQEERRQKDMPSIEELNKMDGSLDQLLNKMSGSIGHHVVDTLGKGTTGASQQQAVVDYSQGTAVQMSAKLRQAIPEYIPSGLSPEQLLIRQGRGPKAPSDLADDADPGRVQAYVVREVMEAKNNAESQGKPLDLEPWVHAHAADAAKLQVLFQHCSIPRMAKIKTFGHEYAFARPPAWWAPPIAKGAMFRSEAGVLEAAQPFRQIRPSKETDDSPSTEQQAKREKVAGGETPKNP
mmetsp:Transcript_19291/g.33302  ORF Transcript_19291/g.33302 Transcript_19291/m.33302 type:complete len:271 (+) Transcript_19291:77-889(+)